MLKMFFIFSVISGVISYMNIDPMKSSFFLIFSLLFSMPLMTMSMHIWFSYFVCLLFLSGIFVILVYFSSLSKINITKSHLSFLLLFLSLIFLLPNFLYNSNNLNLSGFYYSIYWFIFCYILFILLFFMNFSSYFLNFSGALRKL
uniref:NADH dehydrogenase subunit 6 n=1 Tax=Litoditis aff. marina PmIII TaxID=1656231 RepID=A0A0K0WVJ8_9BILA|nr:NADH dehydrogenase subunit 6 [Litoditis aff. marina PmIII]AKS28869.1 NADH dehydrogenase subunit 6 [Litoditis aff. marina PmIII]